MKEHISTPDWAKDAVWYQIFPERFRNGDRNNDPDSQHLSEGSAECWRIKDWGGDWYAVDEWEEKAGGFFRSVGLRRYGGDLQGIIDKLDYLADLGVTALYLNPVFRSGSAHKYDGKCFHHIEETFGPDPEGDRRLLASANETDDPATWLWTSADRLFLKLITEAHCRNLKVIIDGVFNHCGRDFFAFEDLLKNRQKSGYKSWYNITAWTDSLPDGFEYKGWENYHYLPEFRRDQNNVDDSYKNYVFNITRRWLKPDGIVENGVDGWRLDVAPCMPDGFWKDWRKCVKAENPDAYIAAEISTHRPEYMAGDEFDACMNYQWAFTCVDFFANKKNKINAAQFDEKLDVLRKDYAPETCQAMMNLLSSHDTPRMRTLFANPDRNYHGLDQKSAANSRVYDSHDYQLDRGTAEQKKAQLLFMLFQMCYVGAPMIYYGDELGMTGANDPDCRKPMLWPDIGYARETAHPIPGKTGPCEANEPDSEIFNFYKTLIKIRKSEICLRRGSVETLAADDAMFVFARAYKEERLIVALNNGAETGQVEIKAGNVTDLLSGEKFVPDSRGTVCLNLRAYSAVILAGRQ
ncbi:MAG: glycoside hydrolase family 13 protein [Elusimicrobiaceae bacterium]